jgi:hypothetical protein
MRMGRGRRLPAPLQAGLSLVADAADRCAMRLGIDAIEGRVKAPAALLREELAKQPGVSGHDLDVEKRGLASETIDSWQPACDKSYLSRSW